MMADCLRFERLVDMLRLTRQSDIRVSTFGYHGFLPQVSMFAYIERAEQTVTTI